MPKYQQVFEALSKDITSGKYKSGQKFPSEAALVQQFRTSRITIGRALRELSQRGLIDRIAGSGTYVRANVGRHAGLMFGLLIPDLGNTEIFEPICHGIANAPSSSHHALIWGHTAAADASAEKQAIELCEQYIEKRVSGVFFAPVEDIPPGDRTNLKILSLLEEARIPIVLLDRCVMPYPRRSRHDLVGIDHRRAAYLATEHLIKLGARRLAFVSHASRASAVEARIAGFQEALLAHGIDLNGSRIHRFVKIEDSVIGPLLDDHQWFVCVNDRIAGHFMHSALGLGYRIPEDIRLIGIDDVEYASLLPIPLTTIHQPCREIGAAAVAAMLERIARPELPVRDILLECKLIVRETCGAKN